MKNQMIRIIRAGLTGLILSLGALFPFVASAAITTTSGQISVISPPASVISGPFSNTLVYIFPEQTSLTLTSAIQVDISRPGMITNAVIGVPTNIAPNTVVDSYYMHHASSTSTSANANVTFNLDVLGIICLSSNLAASHGQLGAPGTFYQLTNGTQGCELGFGPTFDRITLSANRRTVTFFTASSSNAPDDIRILTAAAESVLPPIANAGTNQTVNELTLVRLSGAGSFDPNTPPRPLTFLWSQISGIPAVGFTNLTAISPMFFAPNVPAAGAVLVFQLRVSNGVQFATNTVTVNVNNVNAPPTAKAGTNQTVGENSLVTLDGSASSDPDGDLLTLQWSQIGGPTVSLSGANTVNPTFTAPDVTFAQPPIALTFQLVVNDGQVNSGPASVTITVTNFNDAPLASAGNNQTVNELQLVTLDGTASFDQDGNALTFSWTQILGSPTVTLNGANTATPSFTAPALDVGGTNTSATFTFQLTVSDGIASSTSTVDVRVNNVNHAPIADAGTDQTVPSGSTVTLNGPNSADEDGDPIAYTWTQTAGPTVTLNDADTATPGFVAPVVGPAGDTLSFQLTVNDGFVDSAADSVTVNVTYVNHPPTASAGSNQTVNEGDTATLSGSASDPDGNELTYSWSQINGPTVPLTDAASLSPSFTAPFVTRDETNVVLRFTASDAFGGSASSDVTVHIANINHAPVAQAPANMTVPEGTLVSLIGQATDPDTEEQSQLTYAWTQTSGPAVSLSGAGANVSFTAPLVTAGGDPNARETLSFALTVTDPNGASSTGSVEVVVANVDHSPTAVAGNNLVVNEGSSVTLNGSASSDPDLDPLSFSWVQVSGPAVTLNSANTALPQFAAPFVGAAGATLQFRLTVDDGFGGANSATTTVTVNNVNNPPNIDNAQPSIATLWPPNHAMESVSIIGIMDADNNATISITSVTQDEATNGTGDGDTAIDAVINSNGTVLLRAERAGNANGRVYHIHFTASDFEGSASGVVKVVVPNSKKSDQVIDGGELYDSTQ